MEKFGGLIIGAFLVGGALKLFNIDLEKLIAEATNGVRVEIVPPEERAVDIELEDILKKAREELGEERPPGFFEGEDILETPSEDISEISPGGPEDIPVEDPRTIDTVALQRGACERSGGTFDELNFVCVFTSESVLPPRFRTDATIAEEEPPEALPFQTEILEEPTGPGIEGQAQTAFPSTSFEQVVAAIRGLTAADLRARR